eukprot:TRINITY_DN19098_c0_g1_i1.p1 TRINITY_DN19098_c0_g1~~TRINITY_DN19098_c0_g1_i1.p1  ORF type:complete len:433 (+),score=116.73 TRINITY_DN19098_c0_g1_i1:70-1299(+)
MLLASVAAAAALPSMRLRKAPQDIVAETGAACLDGSPPGMYMRTNASSTSWVLFLEGGGWCFGRNRDETLEGCAARAKGGGGSSKGFPASLPDFGGVLGASAVTNPGFHTWNAVFLKYCDGSSFGGGRAGAVEYKGQTLHFRGRANFDAMVTDLMQNFGMSEATEVVLSGGSAGGLAVFYNVDHLAEMLPDSVRLTGFPDAGFFLDHPTKQGVKLYRSQFQGADPVWNVTGSGGTNSRCLAAADAPWKCLFAEYLLPHVRAPMFVMNSAYDGYQLPNILNVSCMQSGPESKCAADDVAAMNSYRSALVSRVAAGLANSTSSGCYVDSCWVHEQNVNYCSGQGEPNCVGWDPRESGSERWGYTTAVRFDGGLLTPQAAFTGYYAAPAGSWNVFDSDLLSANPSCPWNGPK